MSALSLWEDFWFDRTMEASRLAALRIGFFGLFAVDQLHLMTSHAWRFGAGGVNLAQFDWLDPLLPLPRTEVHLTVYLVCAFLSVCVAAGVASRIFIPLLTALYGYAYFSSMADGYQHHYLLFWMLLVCCFIRFDKAPGLFGAAESEPGEAPGRVRSWGLSLLYAQIAIVYLFTAITKVDVQWINGWALEQQVSEPAMRALFTATNDLLGLQPLGAYAIVATSVMLWQFLAAASFVSPRLHAIACITGLVFHVTIEFIGIEIRWFSYYMIALYYLLLFPDHWYAAVADWLSKWVGPMIAPVRQALAPVHLSESGARSVTVATVVVVAGLASQSALPGRWLLLGALVGAVAIGWSARKGVSGTLSRSIVMVCAAAAVCLLPARTGAAYDYYRFQGGDYLSRGDQRSAVESYYKAIELNPGPDSRHHKLAGVLIDLGRAEEAAVVTRLGLATDPTDARLLRRQASLQREDP